MGGIRVKGFMKIGYHSQRKAKGQRTAGQSGSGIKQVGMSPAVSSSIAFKHLSRVTKIDVDACFQPTVR
jgi:hypothetical protein